MNSERILHFSLGPVQGFVAQARKTRDFWAGSFILSYLTGHAMCELIESGGKMILPYVDDEEPDLLLAAIQRSRKSEHIGEGPVIATIPNRFMAFIPAGFDPKLCVQAVERAWQRVAKTVWENYMEPVADKGQGTWEIWERQVNTFWEIAWAVGGESDKDILGRRKNWRCHVLPEEPGDKCTLMGNLQELSGYVRSRERKKQDAFWAALRKQVGGYEIDEKERLSAIGLIKRLFPLGAEKAIGWRLSECERYPSTPYLAALPWIEKAVEINPDGARQYAAAAARLPGAKYRENPERFPRLQKALSEHQQAREFASLDGNCFFTTAIANPRLWDIAESQRKIYDDLRQQLIKKLKQLHEEIGASPSSFYALLFMDGDRMGALLKNYKAEEVSRALNGFSKRVKEIISEYNGVTVYAGGDDVLALLPLDGALKAAVALHCEYGRCFARSKVPPEQATISGALIYAHYNTPLASVIREAHRLLDDVAKAKTGRDSLAITVWKGAGRVLTWAAPWQIIRDGKPNIIDEMVDTFKINDSKDSEYNNTFFYNLRAQFRVLADEEGHIFSAWTEDEMINILAAEYLKNREREVDWSTAQQRMKRLLKICHPAWRDKEGNLQRNEKALTLDGALLVKFLVQKGVER
ncbi:MAG TPA: type III-B CRISPR-associated protein Cas10/Cmr2 [Syntrophomonadaceae bacterium]|nr:type III-B CRISPR-associated protein Cas10/Cmr2 [Syntrophomonadaceae bacterium]